MSHTFTNALIHETSPYLLQHAHNPVNWFPWGEEALSLAKEKDLPILVSIGYAACHWCHVMERESFEDESTASWMNEHFVNIKIDREERPDLDHIYMDAVQAISGSGGWPLNVFLTTSGKPFYGGTYFPPQKAYNRPSWKDVLAFISDAWKNRRKEIEEQAETLLQHINNSGIISPNVKPEMLTGSDEIFNNSVCRIINDNILKSADTTEGGFGHAPKFPQTIAIQFLLAYSYFFNNEKSLEQAELSLQKMLQGGIYDQLGGGMARYSTDTTWLAPHFEKMLYDNALLVLSLCDAWLITGKPLYKNYIEKTLDFFIREMKHPEGGFYAAIDADSEGVEGKFYVWDKFEIDKILGNDAAWFCEYYGVTESGNWEHKNILHIRMSKEALAARYQMQTSVDEKLKDAQERLMFTRAKRVRPQTDDKILLGWNALMLTALARAGAILENEMYKEEAIQLESFLLDKMSEDGIAFYHTYKNGFAKHLAFLDDYACLVQSLIVLQELSGEEKYLYRARDIVKHLINNFYDEKNGFFYFTHKAQSDVVSRKQDIYDGATPSGNSLMAENLLYLAVVFDEKSWEEIAKAMLKTISPVIIKYPTSFAVWCNTLLRQTIGFCEIAITGRAPEKLLAPLWKIFIPNRVLQSSTNTVDMPLLRNKNYHEEALAYVCINYSCSAPVAGFAELEEQIRKQLMMK